MNHHRRPPPGPHDELDPRWGLVPALLVLAALTAVLLLPHDEPPPPTVAAMPLSAEFPPLTDTGPAAGKAPSATRATPRQPAASATADPRHEEDNHAPTF